MTRRTTSARCDKHFAYSTLAYFDTFLPTLSASAPYTTGDVWQQSAHFGGNNDGPPRLHRRRDSFVVEHSLDFHHPSAGSGESLAQDTLWNDTGDELTPTRPCSPSSGNTNMAGRKTMFPRPSPGSNGLREACSRATEAERSDRHDKAPVLHGIPNRHVRKKSEVIEGQTRRGGGISPHRCVTPKRCQPFLPDLNRDTFGGGAKGRPSRWGLQKPVLVNGERETSFERGSFKRAEHREVGGFLGGRHGGNGSREECRGEALVQGCCNWLLAGNVAKVNWYLSNSAMARHSVQRLN